MNLTLNELYNYYETMISENYSQKDIDWLNEIIVEKENQLLENTSATGTSGGGSTGVALSNATTAGMGGVVSPQPSAFPGALNGTDWASGGGKSGSGDIGVPYNPSGKNRVFQKVPAPMGKGHGARTGQKTRKKRLNMKALQDIFKKGKESTGSRKVMNFNDFEKSKLDQVTKVKEGKTYKASKKKYEKQPWDEDKKEAFRKKVEDHIKSLDAKVKQVGNDFELMLVGDKVAQIMFRDDYIGIKPEGKKFTDEFQYNELGKIKKKLTKLIQDFE